MTPEQRDAILEVTKKGLDGYIKQGHEELLRLIRAGKPPREAIAQVLGIFPKDYAGILSTAFTAILNQSIGVEDVLAMQVSGVKLSRRIYNESQQVSASVIRLVNDHLRGFQEARALALRAYEGYRFNPAEALNAKDGQVIPRYLRRILSDPLLKTELNILYARIQAAKLKTPALKASYMQLLDSIENGAGHDALVKKLDVAYHEKMRYFASRIAQTELHRAWSNKQVDDLLAEPEIEFVEWRLSGTHSGDCICLLFASQNRYGLGRGVYPKHLAPKPGAHPFCRCSLVPRIDIPPGTKWKEIKGADRGFLQTLDEKRAARVMGSRAKLKSVLDGKDARDVYNKMIDPFYRVKLVSDVPSVPLDVPPVTPVTPSIAGPQFWDASTEAGAWHANAFTAAPLFIKRAIKQAGEPKHVQYTPNEKRAYYQPVYGFIEMGVKIDKSATRNKATWRHEFGHLVDHRIGAKLWVSDPANKGKAPYLSSTKPFKAAINADARVIKANAMINLSPALHGGKIGSLQAFYAKSRDDFIGLGSRDAREAWLVKRYQDNGLDYDEFREAMQQAAAFPDLLEGIALQDRYRQIIDAFEKKDFQKLMDAITGGRWTLEGKTESIETFNKGVLSNLSDLIGSATRNNVSGVLSGFGHDDSYYKRASHLAYTEVFANLFDYYGSNNRMIIKIIEHFMPKTTAIFKGVLGNE